jgi:hypothetical protein
MHGANDVQLPPAPRRGIFEGSAGVLRELLRTPRLRQSIEVVLGGLDPENAPSLVRAVTADHALFLDLLASAPALWNAAVGAARELLGTIAREPEGVLRSVSAPLLRELDAEGLGRAAGLALGLVMRARGDVEVERALEALGRGATRGAAEALAGLDVDLGSLPERFVAAALRHADAIAARLGPASLDPGSPTSRAVLALAEGLPRLAARHPDFVEGVARPVVSALRATLARRTPEAGDAR